MSDVMQCQRCGTVLERPGQGHHCQAAQVSPATPPGGWVAATWAAAVLSVLLAACTAAIAVVISAGAATQVITLVKLLAGLATIATMFAAVAWVRTSRRVADRFGVQGRRYVFAWGLRAWSFSLVLGFSVQYLAGAANEQAVTVGVLLRSFGAVVLLADVLVTRTRIHKLLAGLVGPPQVRQTYSPTDGIVPQPSDWDASQWDPGVLAEIERRRRAAD